MIGRIVIILVALQLVVTSAFAHAMPMPEHCAEPVALQMPGEELSDLQDQVGDLAVEADHKPKPTGLLHCGSVASTDQFGGASVSDLHKDFRVADLDSNEPRMPLQSVLLSHLRPPLI